MNRKTSPNVVELDILIGAISHVNHLLHPPCRFRVQRRAETQRTFQDACNES